MAQQPTAPLYPTLEAAPTPAPAQYYYQQPTPQPTAPPVVQVQPIVPPVVQPQPPVQQQGWVSYAINTAPTIYVVKSINPLSAPTHTEKKKQSNLFSSLSTSISKTVESSLNSVTHELDKGLRIVVPDKHIAQERWHRNFGFPPYEDLHFEQPCKAATVDNVLAGHLYLSHNFLCFYSEFQHHKIRVTIPLREITVIQKAVVGKSTKETLPNIIPPQGTHVLADHKVIEVFTFDGKLYQFFSFGPLYETLYDKIVDAWRGCIKTTPLPVPAACFPPQIVQSVPPPNPYPQQPAPPPAYQSYQYYSTPPPHQ